MNESYPFYPVGYYGRFDIIKPIRSLVEDLLIERKLKLMEEMREMENRLKRHITECKREIIKEIQSFFSDFQVKIKPKKELKNAR